MTPGEKYNNWMDHLIDREPFGTTKHRIIPKYVDKHLYNVRSNQVLVSDYEHFHIHELLHKRDQTLRSFSAWLAVANISDHGVSRDIVSSLNKRWSEMAKGPSGYSYGKRHTEEHKQWLSKLRTGKGNTQYGTTGWTNAWCNDPRNRHSLDGYAMMDDMYDFYIANRHKKRGWGYRAFGRSIGWKGKAQTLYNPMRYAQLEDPRTNPDWVAFKEKHCDNNRT